MDFKQANKVLIYTLILNWIVALAKFIYGTMTRSASMTADGLHSFADGSNNIVGLVGFKIAGKPIDKTHPYGHEKYETITAMGIGTLLLYVSFEIATAAFHRIGHPVIPDVNMLSFMIMAATVLVNISVCIYEHREGKRLKSDFLVSDALHTRSDILVSASVIITLIAVKLGVPMLDIFGAFIISGFIAYSALSILWKTSRVLSDAAMVDQEKIRTVMSNFKSVEKCHKIRSRGREDSITMDMHIHVKPTMNIEEAHKLSHEIEAKIREAIPGVREVISHIEPSQ